MSAIFQNVVDLAKEMLSDEFGAANVEVTLVQTHYMPNKQQTIFMIVAQVGNLVAAGSGESTGKAISRLIAEFKGKEVG
jgi:hypothetical protein